MYSYTGGGGRTHVEATARTWAAARNLQMLERLVEANPDADLDDIDGEGISALMIACETVSESVSHLPPPKRTKTNRQSCEPITTPHDPRA